MSGYCGYCGGAVSGDDIYCALCATTELSHQSYIIQNRLIVVTHERDRLTGESWYRAYNVHTPSDDHKGISAAEAVGKLVLAGV